MISRDVLEAILRTLPRLTIGLVGDLFLDRYLHLIPGSQELSIETGLEAYQIERVRNSPGALGTVMNNLAALGAGLLVPVTAIGDDGHGYDLLREVRRLPVDPSNILCLPGRLTPTYTKPLRLEARSATKGIPDGADGQWRELNRLDVRTRGPLSEAASAEVCRRVEEIFRTSDALIVLDQLVDEDCGVVNSQVRGTIEELALREPAKLVFVDSRRFLGRFRAGVLKGNRAEVLGAAHSNAVGNALRGVPGVESEPAARGTPQRAFPTEKVDAAAALQALCHKTGRAAFCTAGETGIMVAKPDGDPQFLPACPVTRPIDIVGAGDAATSGIVSGLVAGASELEAAAFGNLVASITIQQLGTTGTATPEQVRQRWQEIAG